LFSNKEARRFFDSLNTAPIGLLVIVRGMQIFDRLRSDITVAFAELPGFPEFLFEIKVCFCLLLCDFTTYFVLNLSGSNGYLTLSFFA